MDSRRFVVSSAASCLLSWRLAVFIFPSGVLGGCPLGLLAACARVSSRFGWGIRASRARRVDHNAGAGLSQGLLCLMSRGAAGQAGRRWSRAEASAEACRGEPCRGGGCDDAAGDG